MLIPPTGATGAKTIQQSATGGRSPCVYFDYRAEPIPIMEYVMLIYTDPTRWAGLSREERNRIHAECGAWHEDLVRKGQSRAAIGLQPITTATTVGQKNGDITITDGPFAETKEFLGGLETVECKDLDEALAIAKRFPAIQVGSLVEVRPAVTGGVCRD